MRKCRKSIGGGPPLHRRHDGKEGTIYPEFLNLKGYPFSGPSALMTDLQVIRVFCLLYRAFLYHLFGKYVKDYALGFRATYRFLHNFFLVSLRYLLKG